MVLALAVCAAATTVTTGGAARQKPSPAPLAASLPAPDPSRGERLDGRVDQPDRRRWRIVPQLLLAPLRGLEWLLRVPIDGLLRVEDRYHPVAHVVDALTWSGGDRGIRPAFYYSTIYVPEAGLRYFDHRTLGRDTRLSLTATVGGARYVSSSLSLEPTRSTRRIGVTLDALFDRRGDLLYNGLGSHTYSAAPAGRYLMNSFEGRVGLRVRALSWLGLYATASAGLKRFGNGDRIDDDPGVLYLYDPATIQGFVDGTTFVRGRVGLMIDTRNSAARPATGVVVHLDGDYTHGVGDDPASYERVNASVGVPIALWKESHVLWLQASARTAWQNDAPIPFSELPTLGGPEDLRGFRFQDYRDYTAFFATAEYRWPLQMWLDGALFVDYGGVFGRNFAGFGARQMEPDVGIALSLVTSSESAIRVQLGYGFGEGFNFSFVGSAP